MPSLECPNCDFEKEVSVFEAVNWYCPECAPESIIHLEANYKGGA